MDWARCVVVGSGPLPGERAPLHDRGVVLTPTRLMLAAGGEVCSDIELLVSQPRLFGEVASDATSSASPTAGQPQRTSSSPSNASPRSAEHHPHHSRRHDLHRARPDTDPTARIGATGDELNSQRKTPDVPTQPITSKQSPQPRHPISHDGLGLNVPAGSTLGSPAIYSPMKWPTPDLSSCGVGKPKTC